MLGCHTPLKRIIPYSPRALIVKNLHDATIFINLDRLDAMISANGGCVEFSGRLSFQSEMKRIAQLPINNNHAL